jgi:putative transposase
MLNEHELDDILQLQAVPDEGRRLIRTIRTSEPSRRTRSGPKNVACRYPSKKMGVTIQAESHTNELAALYEWDHDEVTQEFYDQPPSIKLSYRAKNGRMVYPLHTPDYFVISQEWIGWVECKTEEQLLKLAETQPARYQQDGEGNWRCPPGEMYAEQFGLGYRVRSSRENEWILLRNLTFLSDYMDADCPDPTDEQRRFAAELFRSRPWMPLIDLVRADARLPSDAVYKLIVDGDLYFPMRSQPLAELEYAIIYRDETAAEAYRLQSQPLQSQFESVEPVEIAPGGRLLWAGAPWRIENVGGGAVFLRNAEGHSSRLRQEELDDYLREGLITGLPPSNDADRQHAVLTAVTEASPEAMQEAVERYRMLHPEHGVPSNLSRCPRTLKRLRKQYREAELLHGNGMVGLYPQIHRRGNRCRKLDEAVIKIMKEVIQEKYLVPHRPTRKSAYGEAVLRCKDDGLVPPSAKAFRAEINRISRHEQELKRSGKRAAYAFEEFYWRLDMTTPRHGERPFDIAHIDHTQLDIEVADRRYGKVFDRPWLSVMLDAYSREPLAYWISFDSPSYVSCMMLIKECVKRHARVPRILVLDGGSEFDSVYFETLIAHFNILKKSRAKSKARFGSVLERFFGTTNTQMVHNLRGNTQATKTPRQCTPSHNPRKHVAWTLAGLHEAFGDWLDRVYRVNEHPALGVSPAEAFATGLLDFGNRAHKRISYTKGFELMCMPSTSKGTAKVNPVSGIKVNYRWYWCAYFRDPALHRKSVPVRYDPQDASLAFAYVGGCWVECRSELAGVFARRSVKEITLITQEIRARDREMGRKGQVTAERIAEYLRDADGKEKVQRQQWHDQEHRDAHDVPQPPDAEHVDVTPAGDSAWGDIQPNIYGDF